jgi:hypothetical protein
MFSRKIVVPQYSRRPGRQGPYLGTKAERASIQLRLATYPSRSARRCTLPATLFGRSSRNTICSGVL